MADKPSSRSIQAPGGSAATSYSLPAYGSPQAEPSPAIREPGAPPSSIRPPREKPVSIRLPGRSERLAPDDRLARPEAGEEYIDGQRIECLAADAEHADPQCRLAYVVSACVAPGYVASTELLTRTDEGSDFATDVCVRKEGIDPATGGRYLEELSFEVANTQTLKNLEAVRVPKLMARGVRRLFAILVQEGDVLEWSTRGGGKWKGLGPEDVIRDRTLHSPLRVTAILDAAEAKRQVSEALLAEGEPYLMGVVQEREAKGRAEGEAKGRVEGEARGRAKGRVEGEARGLAEAILRAFKHHGVELDAPNRRALLACRDRALLERWLDKALAAESASHILAELEETS